MNYYGHDDNKIDVVENVMSLVGKRQYANALEKMTGFRPLIFYTNGFETYIWDDVIYPERRLYGMFSKEDILSFWIL